MVQPHEFFLGFMRYYNALNISNVESQDTETKRVLSYFDMMGRMLGYSVTSELTMKTVVGKVPESVEKMKIDQLWMNRAQGQTEYELALESQLTNKLDRIKKDIRKLARIPANNLLLYCNWNSPEEVLKIAKKAIKKYGKMEDTKFLVIVDPWTDPKSMDVGKFNGYLLNTDGEIIGHGTAVGSVLKDEDQSLRVISNSNWSYSD